MSVDYSAKLVYGVRLNETEIDTVCIAMKEHEGYEDMIYPYFIRSNMYDPDDGTTIIGITIDFVNLGDSTEINITIPPTNEIDKMLDILDLFHIEREPIWHLICEVS